MFELKPLSKEGVHQALEKADHYRLLNHPAEAESICLDVLEVEPDNQHALVTLLLALTDRLSTGYTVGAKQAREVVKKLTDEYQRAYYSGLIAERQAKARLSQGGPGAGYDAYEWLREAMHYFEQAETLRPSGNDDAILRWNGCVRVIRENSLSARPDERHEMQLE